MKWFKHQTHFKGFEMPASERQGWVQEIDRSHEGREERELRGGWAGHLRGRTGARDGEVALQTRRQ